ncbi:FadR family transcriptional regulator [Mesorhizobium sp. B2-4-15]|uniref:FadR/GntR family transcriptional regulator n=1 Tax=Mesorhizobium sp. B2-4-15 TaxID=2589934 RepID=UPI0011531294|nr:FadR/GntR family transcriptional regulator [Mesorhizobium sp. B2-4-15]TPK62414.1 FadR family transcriptional regulator [Mesorhizobium sp. B2-4-15]
MAYAQKTKLSERLYETMRQLVESGEWSEGTRIPTEMELAEQHGVSRPVVREALIRLRNDGIIKSKRGSGSYVLNGSEAPTKGFRPIENVADLIQAFEFRLTIECDAAAVAALRRGDEAMEAIVTAHNAFEEGISDEAFGDLDLNFHISVAQASQNSMYASTMSMLHRQIVFGMRLTGQFATAASQTRLEVVRQEHSLIVEAIAVQDPLLAYAAMFDHLTLSRRRLLGFDAVLDWKRAGPTVLINKMSGSDG